jgi:RNA polymerase sigma factor (sigma-70 family)
MELKVCDRSIGELLGALRSSKNSRDAWVEFLKSYSPILYQTARACTSDEDAAADCYLHICEELARNRFRRLLKFKIEGSASFITWLRVVARNLCFDWHRSRSGRHRPFKSLQHLSQLEVEVYNCRFNRGFSQEETLQQLKSTFPGVSLSELAVIEGRLHSSLSSRQHWILSTRKQLAFSRTIAAAGAEGGEQSIDVIDPRPDQETFIIGRQQQIQLEKCLASLPTDERLILQLRFGEDLSLEEIAHLTGLDDAQRVHRRIAAILKRLRAAMQ